MIKRHVGFKRVETKEKRATPWWVWVGVILICGTGFNAAKDTFVSKVPKYEQYTRERTKQELREMRWRAEEYEAEERWRIEHAMILGQAEATESARANQERVELEKKLRRQEQIDRIRSAMQQQQYEDSIRYRSNQRSK